MANFDVNAILRGAQLTAVGALRALENPALFRSEYFRLAFHACVLGLALRLIVGVPIVAINLSLRLLSLLVDLETASWDDRLIDGLQFVTTSVLQLPLVVMNLIHYVTPALDQLFLESLEWVDTTNLQRHGPRGTAERTFAPNLLMYTHSREAASNKSLWVKYLPILTRYGKRAVLSLAVYGLSFLPYVGKYVLPAASFVTFRSAVGTGPATVIFGVGILLPRRYIATFLSSFFHSRALMRQLLEPYLSRIRFTREQRAVWFREREGILFGFAIGFWIVLTVGHIFAPLAYLIAESSTAYLITKITDPPPPPAHGAEFAASQIRWRNKHEFLSLRLRDLDHLESPSGTTGKNSSKGPTGMPRRSFS